MSVSYDAAIIGAGADGLSAAAHLARAGLRVVVVERGSKAGGRLQTKEFHPGHHASPFQDDVPEIPAPLRDGLALALHQTGTVDEAIRQRQQAALSRVFAEAAAPAPAQWRRWLERRVPHPADPWPGSDLATASLSDWNLPAPAGSAIDPRLAGSALTLLSLPRIAPAAGGLGALGDAFAAAATAAGVEIRLGAEGRDVEMRRDRLGGRHVRALVLADGGRIETPVVISTLDFKQSILGLFRWNALPAGLVAKAGAFRMAGSTARLLLALRKPLRATPLSLAGGDDARAAWRRGAVPADPPLTFDPVSGRDPSLAPAGGAVASVTIGCMPHAPFDAPWSPQRRLALAAQILRRLESAIPGVLENLLGVETIVPPDIEAALGTTHGDLEGGLIAPDQALGLRPGMRTALKGFYLGGKSTAAGPLGTGAAGLAAAVSVLADARPLGAA